MKNKLLIILLSSLILSGCTDAEHVSTTIAQSADYFNVTRNIEVINTRTGDTLYEYEGLVSVTISGDRLDLIIKVNDNEYKKDIIKLNQDTMYIIRDIEGTEVNK